MDDNNVKDKAIEDMQSRIAFQEDTISKLNDVVAKQAKQLFIVQKQIMHLYSKLGEMSSQWDEPQQDNQPPPHY